VTHAKEDAMKEMDTLLKTVSDGLKILAQGVRIIADKLETFAEQHQEDVAESPVKPVPVHETQDNASSGKTPGKAAGRPISKGKKTVSASDRVYKAMSRMNRPVEIALLAEKTGLNKKQVQNALYRLKKEGRVENVSKGVYRTMA
jgi:predicted Rossmann fold nucleotide-binding protein DprA/Smf involved in DNA uptake